MPHHPLTDYKSVRSSFNGIYLTALVLNVIKRCFFEMSGLSDELT